MRPRRDPLLQQARRLMFEIRAQVSPKDLVFQTKCLDCEGPAVNGGCCAKCLTKGLSYIIGTANANQYLDACVNMRAAEEAVLQLVDK